MRNYFFLDGKSSADFGTYLASATMFDAPERDVSSVEVPGRNGNLIYDNGRFKNFGASVSCYIPKDMKTYVAALRNWLLALPGYVRYEDTMRPEEYRILRYTGGFELGESDRVGASVKLSFDAKPQRWLKTGERLVSVMSGASLYNPTRFDALPLIVCKGNGSITLNGTTITISGNTGQIYIDCDLQDAYLGSVNKNSKITPNFPRLSTGNNVVTYAGVTEVQIAPRWWTI